MLQGFCNVIIKLVRKMASLASESTSQATVLRKYFSELVRAIQDPVLLAVDLFSAEIITQTLMNRVNCATTSTNTDKTSWLLSAVSDHTSVCPEAFDTFLSVLRKEHGPLLPDIAVKMQADLMLGSGNVQYLRSSRG